MRILRVTILALVLLTLGAGVVWAQDVDPPATNGEAASPILVALAPVVAIATFTERVLEWFWQRYEQTGPWPNKAGVSGTSDPKYVSWKASSSHWLGTLVAVFAIGLTNARFFRLLGFDVLFSDPSLLLFDAGIGGIFDDFTVGTIVDWGMTAGIIGWGGTELTHSIIEGLVKGRNLWSEMREVEAGRKSILDAKFFNEYIAPELEKHGISLQALRHAFQTLDAVGISVDRFIGSMATCQVDQLIAQLESRPATAEAGEALRRLLDGVPEEEAMEIPDVLSLLSPEQRRRFLGA